MAEFPTYEEMAKNVAEKALDDFLYNGKSIREWMQIIASEDCISRAEAIKAIRNYNVTIEVGRAIGKSQLADIVDSINKVQEKMISELPSVQPTAKENLVVGDCISRKAVMDYIKNCTVDLGCVNGTNMVLDVISNMPSIQPKPKTDVLDKIRAEIQGLRNCSCNCSDGIIDDVEDIIDKYKAESKETDI